MCLLVGTGVQGYGEEGLSVILKLTEILGNVLVMEGHAHIMVSVEFILAAKNWEGGRWNRKNQEAGRIHLDFQSGAEPGRVGRMGWPSDIQGSLFYGTLL